MIPTMWEPGRKPKKTADGKLQTLLRLVDSGVDGLTELAAVDSDGDTVASLLLFGEHNEAASIGCAQDCLAVYGYDFSWCRWDSNGGMLLITGQED